MRPLQLQYKDMEMPNPARIRRWKRRHLTTIACVFSVAATSAFFYLLYVPDKDAMLEPGAETVVVGPEAKASDVVAELKKEGFIKNERLMKVALAIGSVFKKIEAGGYYIKRGMSQWQIFRMLANPGMKYVKIAAGLRKQEIADVMGDKLDWTDVEKREFVNVHLDLDEDDLEGKYFPDTYLLPVDSDPEDVGKIMLENYESKVEYLKKKYPNSKVNFDTALRIASIIQREAAGPHDMRLISGIIWNRLFKGMSLSLDATVQYAKGKTGDKWWPQVTAADIRQIESPYNTYKNKGIPPLPISNPSLAAIEAAMNPQKTACLFYIHDDNRQIHCSATGAGHQRNVDVYLK